MRRSRRGGRQSETDRQTQKHYFWQPLRAYPRQSLSLPSNCEGATPSDIVEHNLAAAALQDKPGIPPPSQVCAAGAPSPAVGTDATCFHLNMSFHARRCSQFSSPVA
ncbi:unnamed protein product [Pleuronectes platessa]|uniref:Uncharacterized protein n=1 Tax=Pleuronectes platessa TaxID=8262 RepID=A0A9N7UQM6_PLEPL|nr:unnamed protein product [Pleuronectes platessa]